MAELIPWAEFEQEYAENFSEKIGAPAKPFRMALGALIIKEKLGTSERETLEQIRENPYLQYFIGLSSYSNEAPFEPSRLARSLASYADAGSLVNDGLFSRKNQHRFCQKN